MSSQWAVIDTDAAVLTELAERAQISGVAAETLSALEPALLDKYDAVHGLMCFFTWKQGDKAVARNSVLKDAPVFFAKPHTDEMCQTVALVNVVANVKDAVNVGPHVSQYLGVCADATPDVRGEELDHNDHLCAAHNAFAPANQIGNPRAPKERTQCVVFVYSGGSIWELDGDQEGPILHGDATAATYKTALLDAAKKCEEDVIRDHGGQPLSFSTMVLAEDPIQSLTKKIAELRSSEKPVGALETELAEAQKTRQEGKAANERRRFNYQPAIVELLKALAEKGSLQGLIDEARTGKAAPNTR